MGDTDGDAVELEEYEDGLRTPEPENGAGSGKLCNCRGFRPRPGTKVRAAPYSRNEREWGWGNSCGRCGHGIDSHGISSDAGGLEEDKAEEWLRRVKVAVRLDEMLEVSFPRCLRLSKALLTSLCESTGPEKAARLGL